MLAIDDLPMTKLPNFHFGKQIDALKTLIWWCQFLLTPTFSCPPSPSPDKILKCSCLMILPLVHTHSPAHFTQVPPAQLSSHTSLLFFPFSLHGPSHLCYFSSECFLFSPPGMVLSGHLLLLSHNIYWNFKFTFIIEEICSFELVCTLPEDIRKIYFSELWISIVFHST